MGENRERLEKQLGFIRELDKLKTIKRRTYLLDGSRTENSAEHSWQIALMALLLLEYGNEKNLDAFRIVKMLLVHDIVEIEAGDTYIYDDQAALSQHEREEAAARHLFGLLPEEQRRDFEDLRREYEEGKSAEGRFARTIDRFQPFYHNFLTEGRAWLEHGITSDRVKKIIKPIGQGSATLGAVADGLLEAAVARGYLGA
jgi:putative hydrolase of HD superfamily